MRCSFGTVAAKSHAAPASRVSLRSIEKHQDALSALAGADQAKVLINDQVGDGFRERLQEFFRHRPAPDSLQVKNAWPTGFDLPVRIAPFEQVIHRTQLIDGCRFDLPTGMSLDEPTQPLAQFPGLGCDRFQFRAAFRAFKETRGGFRIDHVRLLEPVQELGAIVQPVRPHATRRGPTVDKVQRQMVAGKESGRSGIGIHDSAGRMPECVEKHIRIVTRQSRSGKLGACFGSFARVEGERIGLNTATAKTSKGRVMNSHKYATPYHPIQELIARRWSPYGFADRLVSDDDLRSIFEAARWSSSSWNEQPWHYIVATKANLADFERLFSCLMDWNQIWAVNASVLVLGCVKQDLARNGEPNTAAEHDLGAATATMTLEATARDLCVHQMIGIFPEKARELFRIPEGFRALTGLAIGYPSDSSALPANLRSRDLTPRTRKPLAEFVFESQFGTASEITSVS